MRGSLPGYLWSSQAGEPFTTRLLPQSEQGRATNPALLALGRDRVDGAPGSLLTPINRSAFGVQGGLRSPLPDKRGGDFRGVPGLGRVKFLHTGATTKSVFRNGRVNNTQG